MAAVVVTVHDPALDALWDARYGSAMWCTKPYKDAVDGQRIVMERLRNAETDSKVVAQLARAFVDLEMLKLRLRMKPAPKPIDVSKPKATGIPSVE